MELLTVIGTRPQFIKYAAIAPQLHACVQTCVVDTGQHYDRNLSEVFFRQLELPKPDINLNAGSGSHADQTAQIMVKFEKIVLKYKPDLVIVYGDVNSTLAASVVCSKTLINGKPIPIAHVEAGLRSFDHTMPEEINRIVTDSLADYLFVDRRGRRSLRVLLRLAAAYSAGGGGGLRKPPNRPGKYVKLLSRPLWSGCAASHWTA